MVGRTVGRRIRHAFVTLLLAFAVTPALVATAAPAAAATCRPTPMTAPAGIGGVARVHTACPTGPTAGSRRLAATTSTPTYSGTPPLANHGGRVMGAPSPVGPPQITLVPIFWAPAGYSFPTGYTTVVTRYLDDIAADSGRPSNVLATTTEYVGSNGAVAYNLRVAPSIVDTTPYPTPTLESPGCTLDVGAVYPDNSGYTTCLDDTQVQAETAARASGGGLGRLYLMFLPQGVESCFSPGNPVDQQCTINNSPSSAFCGYHGTIGPDLLYANLPFPIYSSPVSGSPSCTDDALDPLAPGTVQSPNGNVAADVVLSTTSHEIAEAMTDPFLDAWYSDGDSGSENGDLCSYVYNDLSGTAGALYNQTVNGHHYLTQTEFSNAVFLADTNADACLPAVARPAAPGVTTVSPRSGPTGGGRLITITGTSLRGTTQVTVGGVPTSFTVRSTTRITATTPAHAAVTADVRVTTPGATSDVRTADRYRFGTASVTSLAPSAGPTSAGHLVTVTGRGFTGATRMLFGSSPARFTVNSDVRITAVTPARRPTTVNVLVVNGAGASAVSANTRYQFLPPPRITRVTPASGPHTGGRAVVVTGTGFYRVRAVRFGYTAASFTVNSATRITVRTPAHAAGSVNVLVYSPGGVSAVTPADRYRFT